MTPPHSTGVARLFVGQISFDAMETDIVQLFSFYGDVLCANIMRDDFGRSTGAAFITLKSTDQADIAIQSLHDRYVMGREKPLQVCYGRRSENISEFGEIHAHIMS